MTDSRPHQRPTLAEQLPPFEGSPGDVRGSWWINREIIRGVLYQYCRGIDRLEWPTVVACFHEDGVDDHGGGTLRSPAELVAWLSKRHVRTTSSFHAVMNISFLLEQADEVRTESLCWARQRYSGSVGERQLDVRCRYLDIFEQREGSWAISYRKVVYESVEDREAFGPQVPPGIVGDASRRDRDDPIFSFLAR